MLFRALRFVALSALLGLLGPNAAAVAAPTKKPVRTPPAPAAKVKGARAPRGATRAKPLPRWAPVELFHINRRDTLKLRLVDERGRPVRGVDKRVSKFLRCHHTNTEHRIDPRLVRLIYETARHFGGRRVEVVSGYRHPTVAKNPKSPHMKGLACDFRIVGVDNATLRDHLRGKYQHVGVGYYPNSSFVHLDVRAGASAFWIDYSRPKEDAIYSDDPKTDLRTGRADTWKPTYVDPNWAEREGAEAASDGVGSDPVGPGASLEPSAAGVRNAASSPEAP